MKGLYLHIPFCRQKCFYCDFFSVKYDEKTVDKYVQALLRHALNYGNSHIDTIYIGGGTPSVLSSSQISTVLKGINTLFDVNDVTEFTFEINPESASDEKLKILKENGVNRLSVGLQSVDDDMLKKIGRVHNFSAFKNVYEKARKAGFNNFNLDLIYGLPEQTLKDWQKTLKTVAQFECEHISLYPLSVEKGTHFFDCAIKVNESLQCDMYEAACEFLKDCGYLHYEISNWAKAAKESRHNQNYWRGFEYIALGAGACGYENGCRYLNIRDIQKYIELITEGKEIKSETEFLDEEEIEAEKIMLGLRMLEEGADINDFKRPQNIETLKKFLNDGLLVDVKGRIKLSPSSVFVSNAIMSEFMK